MKIVSKSVGAIRCNNCPKRAKRKVNIYELKHLPLKENDKFLIKPETLAFNSQRWPRPAPL
jgi:hypothetical protein